MIAKKASVMCVVLLLVVSVIGVSLGITGSGTFGEDSGDDEPTGIGMLIWILPLVAIVVISLALVLFMMKGKKGSAVDDESSDDMIEEDMPDEDVYSPAPQNRRGYIRTGGINHVYITHTRKSTIYPIDPLHTGVRVIGTARLSHPTEDLLRI